MTVVWILAATTPVLLKLSVSVTHSLVPYPKTTYFLTHSFYPEIGLDTHKNTD